MTQFLKIHGGGVVWDGCAALFSGSNGVGKTTLVLRLVREGAQVLSDDEAWVDSRTHLIHPADRPLLIKESGLAHFPDYAPMATRWEPEQAGEVVWWLDPEKIRPGLRAAPAPCRAIIIMRSDSGYPLLQGAAQHDVFRELLVQCMNFPDFGSRAVSIMSAVVRQSALFQLFRGDLDESVRLIKEKVLCAMNPSTITTT